MAKEKNKKKANGGRVYVLFDRTGSMAPRIDEALVSTNAYIKALAKKVLTTVAVFDTTGPFDLIRESVVAKDFSPIERREVEPRNGTPLYDSVGKMIEKALSDNPKKAVIVVQTDGQENSSTEYNLDTIKARIEAVKQKGWEILFLGNDFDVAQTTSSFGLKSSKGITRSQGNYQESVQALSFGTSSYLSGKSDAIDFSDDDKAKATGKKKKSRGLTN